jgi:hypothetical protein
LIEIAKLIQADAVADLSAGCIAKQIDLEIERFGVACLPETVLLAYQGPFSALDVACLCGSVGVWNYLRYFLMMDPTAATRECAIIGGSYELIRKVWDIIPLENQVDMRRLMSLALEFHRVEIGKWIWNTAIEGTTTEVRTGILGSVSDWMKPSCNCEAELSLVAIGFGIPAYGYDWIRAIPGTPPALVELCENAFSIPLPDGSAAITGEEALSFVAAGLERRSADEFEKAGLNTVLGSELWRWYARATCPADKYKCETKGELIRAIAAGLLIDIGLGAWAIDQKWPREMWEIMEEADGGTAWKCACLKGAPSFVLDIAKACGLRARTSVLRKAVGAGNWAVAKAALASGTSCDVGMTTLYEVPPSFRKAAALASLPLKKNAFTTRVARLYSVDDLDL